MRKRLVITADDFGLSGEVNEAVERAHREGTLSAASLMVGAPAAAAAPRGKRPRSYDWSMYRSTAFTVSGV